MLKKIIISVLVISIIGIVGCSNTTKNNASPENLYKEDSSIDLLVYKGTAYVNAQNIEWISDLDLVREKEIGAIIRTDVKKGFKEFDATILEVGTQIYSVLGREDIVLVVIGEKWLPYYAYVEG